MRHAAVFMCLTCSLSAALAQSPASLQQAAQFKEALLQNHFKAFEPLRSNNGVGAIVSFDKNGLETIVTRPGACLPVNQVPPERGDAEMMAVDFTATRSDDASVNLSRYMTRGVDVAAALAQGEVSSIRFRLISPFQYTITALDARKYIHSLKPGSPCLAEFKREGNLVIHSALGARGVEYRFFDQKSQQISLTAKMLNMMGLSGNLARAHTGKAALVFNDKELLLGYRAWVAKEVDNLAGSGIQLMDVDVDDILMLQAAASKQVR